MAELRSQRTPLLVLGLIAAIAVGFAIGVLARLPLADRDDAPAADSVDVGFAQDMSTHHNQAIDMAAVALTESTDQPIKNLAFDILTTQQNQVGQMQGWLALWNRPPTATDGYMTWMDHDSSDQHMHDADSTTGADAAAPLMPGMATTADMSALRQARGPALDTLFLQLMLRHHQGGLPMAEYAQQYADQTVVRDLAGSMVRTQQSEAELMTKMLIAQGAQPLPMN
ncbi:DUF305 domain-containing protein [Skermania piniformis]|uniref:DUF305 domain-containing protein n=1 Tax=Skermania pinensis TaxID=39122 RepID=A0ABX8SAD7_9ACTN|nr:DUF305 domain-containing protein [Skermania piniformis]QXQ14743.1 DUF305 domain-containing protein [Skermania piniformis]